MQAKQGHLPEQTPAAGFEAIDEEDETITTYPPEQIIHIQTPSALDKCITEGAESKACLPRPLIKVSAIIAIAAIIGVAIALGEALSKSGPPCPDGVGGPAGTVGFWVKKGGKFEWQCHDRECLETKYRTSESRAPLGELLRSGEYDSEAEALRAWAEGEEGGTQAAECVRSTGKSTYNRNLFGCHKAQCFQPQETSAEPDAYRPPCGFDTHGVYYQQGAERSWVCVDASCVHDALDLQLHDETAANSTTGALDLGVATRVCIGTEPGDGGGGASWGGAAVIARGTF